MINIVRSYIQNFEIEQIWENINQNLSFLSQTVLMEGFLSRYNHSIGKNIK